jgi:hypothetical protein
VQSFKPDCLKKGNRVSKIIYKLKKMKNKIYMLVILITSSISTFAQAPDWLWAKGAGGTYNDYTHSIAVDANGNSYVTGYFDSPTITFGSTVLTNANSAGGTCDIFIVKYDESGNVLWAKGEGGTSTDYAYSITVDANGNSFITGYFDSPSIIFGSTTLTNADNTGNTGDIFIVKYNTSGNVLWAKRSGETYADWGHSVTADASGDLYLTGYFYSPAITFGSITLTNADNTGGTCDVFIAKYDATGNVIWANSTGGAAHDYGYSITVDENGNPFITGYFMSSTITFGSITLTNAGGTDIFVVKYDNLGSVLWAKSAGGPYAEYDFSICVDANGNSYTTGYFDSPTITFSSTTLVNVDNSGNSGDIFIVKYDASGNVLWAKSAGDTDNDYGKSIAVDGIGNSYITGYFVSNTITFGSTVLTNAGTIDIFVVKYDTSGNVLWAKSAGGTYTDYGYSINVDANGNIYISGYFDSTTIPFGNTTLINADNTGNSKDIFVAKLSSTNGTGEDDDSFNAINIFPNPCNGLFRITGSGRIDEIKISDLLGQIIYMAKPEKNEISAMIEIPGVYLVNITTGKQVTTRKLVIYH